MNPNKFFSAKRFGRFLSACLQINQKRYLYTLAGGFIGIYLIILLSIVDRHFGTVNFITPFVFSLFALGVFVGSAFPELSDRVQTGNYLLLPASTFEKILSQFLIYIVCGSILFLLFFWLDAQLVRLTMLHTERVASRQVIINTFHYSDIWNGTDSPIMSYIMTTFVFISGCFLFSVRLFFRRFALVKTVIAYIAGIFFFVRCLFFISHIFYPERSDMHLPMYEVMPSITNWELYLAISMPLWSIFFLVFAYFKFKEKQV